MGNSVKIRSLAAPPTPLDAFDPGEYLDGLDFYETDTPISEPDRDGLAQFVHYLAFLALRAKSSKWSASTVGRGTSAFRCLESHFAHLDGWRELAQVENGLSYRQLAGFLMPHYPPRPPK